MCKRKPRQERVRQPQKPFVINCRKCIKNYEVYMKNFQRSTSEKSEQKARTNDRKPAKYAKLMKCNNK